MLAGDVHASYTARAELTEVDQGAREIHQLTMSPFRNDIEKVAKLGNQLLNRKGAGRAPCTGWRSRARVDDVDMTGSSSTARGSTTA